MIYAPSDDSFLLAECVRLYRGKRALEIGVGSGIILEALEDRFDSVAGTDIDHEALRSCKGKSRALLVCCDAASAFAAGKRFDLIVSNPPYLPADESVVDRTVHGGPSGIEATINFIVSALPLLAESGRILVVKSSLADSAALGNLAAGENLKIKVIREKRLFYETLSVIELSR
ncbi:MAG: HemK2/MTQ2 family protein methyltransferase [Nitrososphaera sp.]